MSNGLVIVSLLTVIAVGKIWLELFEGIIFFKRKIHYPFKWIQLIE